MPEGKRIEQTKKIVSDMKAIWYAWIEKKEQIVKNGVSYIAQDDIEDFFLLVEESLNLIPEEK